MPPVEMTEAEVEPSGISAYDLEPDFVEQGLKWRDRIADVGAGVQQEQRSSWVGIQGERPM